jgi:hypothetical protein
MYTIPLGNHRISEALASIFLFPTSFHSYKYRKKNVKKKRKRVGVKIGTLDVIG